MQGALHQLTFCILLSNRVSTEGVVSLLVDHPNLITLEYERMKEGLALLASSPDLAKRGFQLRKVVLESCREEDVEALEAKERKAEAAAAEAKAKGKARPARQRPWDAAMPRSPPLRLDCPLAPAPGDF